MKTKYKIIILLFGISAGFFTWPIPYNGICNLLDNYDPCSRITGIDIPLIGMLEYDSTLGMSSNYHGTCDLLCTDELLIGKNEKSMQTKNPNECWYREDDGSLTPCKIDNGGFSMAIGMFWVIFGPGILLISGIILSIVIWRKVK